MCTRYFFQHIPLRELHEFSLLYYIGTALVYRYTVRYFGIIIYSFFFPRFSQIADSVKMVSIVYLYRTLEDNFFFRIFRPPNSPKRESHG